MEIYEIKIFPAAEAGAPVPCDNKSKAHNIINLLHYLFFVHDLILENQALHQAIWSLAVRHRKTFLVICPFLVHFKKMYLIYRIASCKKYVKWTGNFDLRVHMIINLSTNYFEIQSIQFSKQNVIKHLFSWGANSKSIQNVND